MKQQPLYGDLDSHCSGRYLLIDDGHHLYCRNLKKITPRVVFEILKMSNEQNQLFT